MQTLNNTDYLEDYISSISDEEKWKYCLAAYNIGEGVVKYAVKEAKDGGVNEPLWDNLLNDDVTESFLYKGMVSIYNRSSARNRPITWLDTENERKSKYEEVSKYVENILKRANQ